jgi:hypothetical protein
MGNSLSDPKNLLIPFICSHRFSLITQVAATSAVRPLANVAIATFRIAGYSATCRDDVDRLNECIDLFSTVEERIPIVPRSFSIIHDEATRQTTLRQRNPNERAP